MKLKRLDLIGFKSFVDKTAIEFPEGISAIVGPNGCGKSNIFDALRWVMGEQSVKQLRGKSMEDIIFSGADGKPPLNMAEVSLTLLNNNGSSPEEYRDYSEIMVTRRLYRSGESAYLINRRPCRLRDIHHLLMGSGMGAKTYAIIQQGNVGDITDAGPEERRLFLEEAAGVTRYKSRKNEALQKLEVTNQNLLRISDIIAEVKRQMAGLKRQAKRAEQYQAYQQRIQKLDVLLTSAEYQEHTRRMADTDALLKDLKNSDFEHCSQIKKIDAAIEDIKLKRLKKNQEISDQKSIMFETRRQIDRIENDLSHLKKDVERLSEEIASIESARRDIKIKSETILHEMEVIDLHNRRIETEITADQARLEAEISASEAIRSELARFQEALEEDKKKLMELISRESQYKNIYQTAANNRETLNRRLHRLSEEEAVFEKQVKDFSRKEETVKGRRERLANEIDDLSERIAILQRELTRKNQALNEQIRQVQTLEMERNKTRSSHYALKKMQDNYEWYKDGVRAVMKWSKAAEKTGEEVAGVEKFFGNEVLGVVADVVTPEPSFEVAVESAFGESLQYILVKDQQAAFDAIDFLQQTRAGRSGFIPVSSIKKTAWSNNGQPPGAVDRLLSHVTVSQGFEETVQNLFDHVAVADSLQDAIHLFNSNGSFKTIVTRQGEVVTSQGILIGGNTENITGILSKKQEIKGLENEIERIEKQLDSARSDQHRMESDARSTESALQKLIEHKNRLNQEQIEIEKTFYKVCEEHKNARRRLEIIQLEQEQMMGEESDIDDEMTRCSHLLKEVGQAVSAAQEGVSRKTAVIKEKAADVEMFNQRIVDLKLKLTSRNAQLENGRTSLHRLQEFKKDGLLQMDQLAKDISHKEEKKKACGQKIKEYGHGLSGMYEKLKTLEQAAEANESDYRLIDAELRETDDRISNLQSMRDDVLQKIRLLELDQSQQQVKRDNLILRLEERYHETFDKLKALALQNGEHTIEEQPLKIEDLENELTQYRSKVAAINDVNLGAIREYDQLQERFDFLTKQREDLVKATEDLHKVIRKINKISQDRFLDVFHQVNGKLGEVFPRLFEGGTASLVLTEPDRPLETGVEFMIHPPGKKLMRMSLLSGGEKALSAIAFIFSIFLIKPASFCLMDEIDAPLDDANIDRFSNLVKIIGEQSQIIMITHNKRSMEFAETLFGVTMESKGTSKVVSVNLETDEP